jgi:hypothetical protein
LTDRDGEWRFAPDHDQMAFAGSRDGVWNGSIWTMKIALN